MLYILLFMMGHMVRDGWPTLHSTHLARFVGALWCFFGAIPTHNYATAALIGAAVLAGFYFDMKHGEGQGPDDTCAHLKTNLPFLMLSGVTSMLPLALLIGWLHGWLFVLIALTGLTKIVIWPFWWTLQTKYKINKFWRFCGGESFFEPTRQAAIWFGAIVGAVSLLA